MSEAKANVPVLRLEIANRKMFAVRVEAITKDIYHSFRGDSILKLLVEFAFRIKPRTCLHKESPFPRLARLHELYERCKVKRLFAMFCVWRGSAKFPCFRPAKLASHQRFYVAFKLVFVISHCQTPPLATASRTRRSMSLGCMPL